MSKFSLKEIIEANKGKIKHISAQIKKSASVSRHGPVALQHNENINDFDLDSSINHPTEEAQLIQQKHDLKDKIKDKTIQLSTKFLAISSLGKLPMTSKGNDPSEAVDVYYFQYCMKLLKKMSKEIDQTLTEAKDILQEKDCRYVSELLRLQENEIAHLKRAMSSLPYAGKMEPLEYSKAAKNFCTSHQNYRAKFSQILSEHNTAYQELLEKASTKNHDGLPDSAHHFYLEDIQYYESIAEQQTLDWKQDYTQSKTFIEEYFHKTKPNAISCIESALKYEPIDKKHELASKVSSIAHVTDEYGKDLVTLYKTSSKGLKAIKISDSTIRDNDINSTLVIPGSIHAIKISMRAGLTNIELPPNLKSDKDRFYIQEGSHKCYLPLDKNTIKAFQKAQSLSMEFIQSKLEQSNPDTSIDLAKDNAKLKEAALQATMDAVYQSQLSAQIAQDKIITWPHNHKDPAAMAMA